MRVRPPALGVAARERSPEARPVRQRAVRSVTGRVHSPTVQRPVDRGRRGTGQRECDSSHDPVVAVELGANVRLFDAKRARVSSRIGRQGPTGATGGHQPACGRAATCGASEALMRDQARAPFGPRAPGRRGAGRARGSEGRARCRRASTPLDVNGVRDEHVSERRMCVPFSQTSATVARPSKRSRGRRSRHRRGETAAIPPVVRVEVARMIEVPPAGRAERRRHRHRPVAGHPLRREVIEVRRRLRAAGRRARRAAQHAVQRSGRSGADQSSARHRCLVTPVCDSGAVARRRARHRLVPRRGHRVEHRRRIERLARVDGARRLELQRLGGRGDHVAGRRERARARPRRAASSQRR